MSDLISKQALVDHIDLCANDLMERGGIVPAGVLVILRDSIEEGKFDADDSEVQRLLDDEQQRDLQADLKLLTVIPRDPAEPVNIVHDVVAPHALRRAIAAEDDVQQLREALAEIKRLVIESRGRIWTGIGIVKQVDDALSPQKGETPK